MQDDKMSDAGSDSERAYGAEVELKKSSGAANAF